MNPVPKIAFCSFLLASFHRAPAKPPEVASPQAVPSTSSRVELEVIERSAKRLREEQHALVFNVPLDEAASRDREEAWTRLESTSPGSKLNREQLIYASDLVEKYRKSGRLEQLVFWRLVWFRMNEQGASSISRVLDEDYGIIQKDLWSKLHGMMYSGLGEDPGKLAGAPPFMKAIEALKAAGRKP